MEANGIISSLLILVVVLGIWGVVQQRATVRVNQLLDRQRLDVLAILADRDGWREAAMRATLIAEVSQGTTERAARAVERVAANSP